MKNDDNNRKDSRFIGQQQQRYLRDEFRVAVRALLMTPLMHAAHDDFGSVRRHADMLRQWFARETGWQLQIEREGARLYKRPADLFDATRGLPNYNQRRYILLCLACAVLERSEPQITLRLLGDQLLLLAAEPRLTMSKFTFTLTTQAERRDLVTVCATLLELGVMQRLAGDEEAFVHSSGEQADALYDVQRMNLSGMLAAARGPSTWPTGSVPVTLDERLHALVDEHIADSEEARRTALRHQLARRLLDDPVLYSATLETEALAYFTNQRGAMATRLCEASGLSPEQRAEGLALTDETGLLTDVAMPAEGTDAHVTLLVAEYLADTSTNHIPNRHSETAHQLDVIDFIRKIKESHGNYWRKSARESGAENDLAEIALSRLEKLLLIVRDGGSLRALPALSRFSAGITNIVATRRTPSSNSSLFD